MGSKFSRYIFLTITVCATMCMRLEGFAQEDKNWIVYDYKTKQSDKEIPFDQPFTLEVVGIENIEKKILKTVNVYKVFYKDGKRNVCFEWPDNGTCKYGKGKCKYGIYPDICISAKIHEKSMIIPFPPLRPNKDFDVLITFALPDNYIDDYIELTTIVNTSPTDTIYANQLIKKLLDFDTNNPFPNTVTGPPYSSFTGFQSVLHDTIDKHLTDYSSKLNKNAVAPLCKELLDTILQLSVEINVDLKKLSSLQDIPSDFCNSISNGLRSLSTAWSKPDVDKFSLSKRIDNLSSTRIILGEILDSLKLLSGYKPVFTVKECIAQLQVFYSEILKNEAFLKEFKGTVAKFLEKKFIFDRLWLVASNESKDLKTKGGTLLSTELGTTMLFAHDNTNKQVYIPRLFVGVNFFFRPVDRKLRLNTLRKSGKIDVSCDNLKCKALDELSSRRTILHSLSLSVGLTFGKIEQKDFQNLYNNMSLTIGPSFRFAQVIRVSAGVAFLNRLSPNPLINQSKLTTAFYSSFSVDVDFVQTAKNVTDLVFK